MRKYLFFALILLFGCSSNKKTNDNASILNIETETIEGFLTIKWGEDILGANAKIYKNFPNATRLLKSDPHRLFYSNSLELLDKKLDYVYFNFSDKGFCSSHSSVSFLTKSEGDLYFAKLQELLVSKYGKPTKGNEKNINNTIIVNSLDSCYVYIRKSDDDLRITLTYRNTILDESLEEDRERTKKENEIIQDEQFKKDI